MFKINFQVDVGKNQQILGIPNTINLTLYNPNLLNQSFHLYWGTPLCLLPEVMTTPQSSTSTLPTLDQKGIETTCHSVATD